MTPFPGRWLFWTPRVLVILFAMFLSVFALDVFGEHRDLGATLVALAMHLIPAAMVVVALLIAWRWEGIGALLMLGLGLVYLVWSPRYANWSGKAVIAGPLFLTGVLFLLSWSRRRHTDGAA